MTNQFYDQKYLIRRKFLTFLGPEFHVDNQHGEVVLYSKLKVLHLWKDVNLYTGADMFQEALTIRGRKSTGLSHYVYDVFDSQNEQIIGSLLRKDMKSIFKDEWTILDSNEQEIGIIKEDQVFLAFLRRFLTNLIPQTYHISMGGSLVAIFKQNFNPFVLKLKLDFSPDTNGYFDKRLGLAAGMMLCIIDRRQY